jgi:hypothetical protein
MLCEQRELLFRQDASCVSVLVRPVRQITLYQGRLPQLSAADFIALGVVIERPLKLALLVLFPLFSLQVPLVIGYEWERAYRRFCGQRRRRSPLYSKGR